MKQVHQVDSNEMYRLMIYFAHSTLIIYSKDIICKESMSINDFRNVNEKLINRVYDEAKSIFDYDLSCDQISKAIHVYFIAKFKPSSVLNTEVFEVGNYKVGR